MEASREARELPLNVPPGRAESSHLSGSRVSCLVAMHLVIWEKRSYRGRQVKSLEMALWGVAMGRLKSARMAPYTNALIFCTRACLEPQNSMPYRSRKYARWRCCAGCGRCAGIVLEAR